MVWHSAGRLPVGEPGHHVGQLGERRLAGEQRVEGRVAQQVQRQRQPLGQRPVARRAGATGADLAGADGQPPGVERAARATRLTSASPYQLRSITVPSVRQQVERPLQPGRGRAGVHDQVAARRRRRRAARTSTPSAAATRGPGRVDVDQRHARRPGMPASSRATQQPTMPAPTHRDPVADQRRRVPERVDRGLDGAGQHGPPGRHAVRDRRRPQPAGTTYARLVRVQAEDGAAEQRRPGPARPRRR